MGEHILKFLDNHGKRAELILAAVVTLATCSLAVYSIFLYQVTRDVSELSHRDFEIRNMSQIGLTNWDIKVEGVKLSYLFQVEERVGAATELKKVETYISANEKVNPNGLYQCHSVNPGVLLHRLGDRYTAHDRDLTLSFRPDGTATTHAVYIYVRLTHRDLAAEKDRHRIDGRVVRFDNDGNVKHS